VAALAHSVSADPAHRLVTVDLVRCEVSADGEASYSFDIDADSRAQLLAGLDALALALQRRPAIESFIARDRRERPWIYLS
jgi:3-isopropylmalate/(R)-2-methylmalate dehydratase small subunit